MNTTTGIRANRTVALAAFAVIIALFAGFLNPGAAQARTVVPARTSTEIAYNYAIVKLLNQERAAHHLRPVAGRRTLARSARGHNLAMARANTMSHQVRGERSLGTRESAQGYKWTWAGENIGWNSDMSAAGVLMLEKAMYNEVPPQNGHRLNILSKHFTNVGVDVYLDRAHHKVWLTVDFGRP